MNPTTPSPPSSVQGITEDDIASFLANTPGFFERHAELMSTIQLTSPHGQRAVSLQERQMEMLRDRIKGLELKIVEMIRYGQENVAIADRLHRWIRSVLLTAEPGEVPQALVQSLQHEFLIPQAAVRVWGASSAHADRAFAQTVSDDVKSFTGSLTVPYCGMNGGFEATRWLPDPTTVMSVAMIPLRHGAGDPAGTGTFGLLVLASPDPTRYSSEMGTEFLMRIGEITSAALSRLK